MATTKRSARAAKITKRKSISDFDESAIASQNYSANAKEGSFLGNSVSMFARAMSSKKVYFVAVIIIVALLVYYKKNWFVAATVNNSPISNFEVLQRINSQYRDSTLKQMVNEKIIMDEAVRNGATVSQKDIDTKVTTVETSVGGAQALDGLLAQQGQTRTDFKNQIKLQLLIEKLYGKDATVSAEEVTKFIEQNKGQMQASDSASQQKEAEDALKQQKLRQLFGTKFQELQKNAKVNIF